MVERNGKRKGDKQALQLPPKSLYVIFSPVIMTRKFSDTVKTPTSDEIVALRAGMNFLLTVHQHVLSFLRFTFTHNSKVKNAFNPAVRSTSDASSGVSISPTRAGIGLASKRRGSMKTSSESESGTGSFILNFGLRIFEKACSEITH
jgi:hypothetical protein